jgi:hypothetical protein
VLCHQTHGPPGSRYRAQLSEFSCKTETPGETGDLTGGGCWGEEGDKG